MTSSESKEVALKAAGSSSWHWDSDIPALPHATGIAFPQLTCTEGQRGAQEAKQDLAVLPINTHTFYPIKHLLLQSISRARQSTRNSSTATHCKGNHFPALRGIFHHKFPPTPQKVSHALHILYSAELGVLSRFLQTKKQVKSEVLHFNRFYIYTESTSLVLSLKQQVKSQTGSFFILSFPSNCWTEEILASFSYRTVRNDPRRSRALDPKGLFQVMTDITKN